VLDELAQGGHGVTVAPIVRERDHALAELDRGEARADRLELHGELGERRAVRDVGDLAKHLLAKGRGLSGEGVGELFRDLGEGQEIKQGATIDLAEGAADHVLGKHRQGGGVSLPEAPDRDPILAGRLQASLR
jgi:hypothetical protein